MAERDEFRSFVQSIIDNVKKHGFPDKKVAFPLERMYEIAEEKGLNFNKVLDTLDSIQIAHKKTPEKIIFYPKDREAPPPSPASEDLGGIDPGLFADLDPNMFKNMDLQQMMGAASAMIENMSPEQLQAVKNMYENMSDEDREAMMAQMKKLGLF